MKYILLLQPIKMKRLLFIACTAVVLASCGDKKSSAKKLPLKSPKDTFSYAMGAIFGVNFNEEKITDINWDVFRSAMEEGMKNGNKNLLMDIQALGMYATNYQLEIKYGPNKKEGEEYIKKHKGEGYTERPSGILFKELKPGTGVKPTITDTVLVFYKGELTDGKIFDSNMDRQPMKVPMNSTRMMPGFMEALTLMTEGSEAKVIIPYELAYGKEGMQNPYSREGGIEGYETLIFTLKMDSIKK